MVVGFFLTPYILHHLGNTAFGLWVLLTTFTGYYGLFDLGIRSAVVRYVARHMVDGDADELTRVTSTSFVAYSLIALVLILITAVAAWQMERLFDVSAEWRAPARMLLIVVGTATALSLPLSLFGGVLEGMQRFTWVGTVQSVMVLARAGLLVYLLQHGGGLVTVGVVTMATNFLASLVYVVVVFRVNRNFRLDLRMSNWSTLRGLASFGLITFWIAIAQVLRFQLDSMVIAASLSLQAVTFYAIGFRFVSYMTDIVQAMSQIFTPMSSAFDASGDQYGLRRVLLMGNRYSAFLSFPVAAVLLICGQTLLRVWVGPAYLSSYSVLAILTIPVTLFLAQAGAPKVLYGMARHHTLAVALFCEGIAKLALSMALVKPYGIEGVAIGTAIPLIGTSVLFLPWHMCRLLHLSLKEYVATFFYPLLCIVPFCLSLWALERWVRPVTWMGLLGEVVAGGLVYGITFLIYYHHMEQPLTGRRSPLNAVDAPAAE